MKTSAVILFYGTVYTDIHPRLLLVASLHNQLHVIMTTGTQTFTQCECVAAVYSHNSYVPLPIITLPVYMVGWLDKMKQVKPLHIETFMHGRSLPLTAIFDGI